MFYTGLDPYTMKEVYVAKTEKEKGYAEGAASIFQSQNQGLVIEALKKGGRLDLKSGTSPGCLVRPDLTRRLRLNKKLMSKTHREEGKRALTQKGKNMSMRSTTGMAKKRLMALAAVLLFVTAAVGGQLSDHRRNFELETDFINFQGG